MRRLSNIKVKVSIKEPPAIQLSIKPNNTLNVGIVKNNYNVNINIHKTDPLIVCIKDYNIIEKIIHVTTNTIYDGPYAVNPSGKNSVILHTKDKVLMDNINVNKIRFNEVQNTSGGYTCIIGE